MILTYRRKLILTLCLSLASIVVPAIVTVVYYFFALKREVHPDGGPGFVHFLFRALEATLPVAMVSLALIASGACGFIISVILLTTNLLVGKPRPAAKTEELSATTH